MAHHRVWLFRPPPGAEAAFERAYGPDGPWARLFVGAAGFLATRLLRPAERGGGWLTIDTWDSSAAFERFQADHGAAYRALDTELEGIAGDERLIGAFDD